MTLAETLRHTSTERLLAELAARVEADRAKHATATRDALIGTLIGSYPPDIIGSLLLEIGQRTEVAFAFADRYEIQSHYEVEFTDAQWARFAGSLEDFDSWLAFGGNPLWDFVDSRLCAAGLAVDDDGENGPVVVDHLAVPA